MSTLLRPVGPLEPRIYWIRRGVVLTVILVVILLVATQCGGGGNKHPSKGSGTHPTAGPTSTPTVAVVTACDPTVLTLTLSTDVAQYTVGQSPKLIGVIANAGTATCTLTTSPQNEIWTIKSGPDKVWTTKGCVTSTVSKVLRIKPEATRTLSTTWDGDRLDSGCTAGSAAQPGEYTLHARLDGVSGKIAVFHIAST